MCEEMNATFAAWTGTQICVGKCVDDKMVPSAWVRKKNTLSVAPQKRKRKKSMDTLVKKKGAHYTCRLARLS